MTKSEVDRADLRVERVAAQTLHDLRRRVLRGGDPLVSVSDARDDDESSQHFGVFCAERCVGAGSFYPSLSPVSPSVTAWQLRYLATDFDVQARGVGSLLLRAAETRLASAGVRQVWANGRDSALGFYTKEKWSLVPGSEHLSHETQLPHTVIFKDILSNEPCEIEWATPRDAGDLARLREEMYFSIRLQEFAGPWIENSRRFFESALSNGTVLVTIARANSGAVVACAAASVRTVPPTPLYPRGHAAYIHSVSTAPAFRRRGVSRVLLEKLIAELDSRGIERAELHATDEGAPLYLSMAFEPRTHSPEMRLSLHEFNPTD